MQAFILDVSACLPWCCEDEQTPFSDKLLEWAAAGSELHVPSVWPFDSSIRLSRLSGEGDLLPIVLQNFWSS